MFSSLGSTTVGGQNTDINSSNSAILDHAMDIVRDEDPQEGESEKARQIGAGWLSALQRREYGARLGASRNPVPNEIQNALLIHEFPQIRVIDEKVWKTVFSEQTLTAQGLTFDDAEPRDDSSLKRFLWNFDFSKIEKNKGMTILTLPKGLTLEKLNTLARFRGPSVELVNFEESDRETLDPSPRENTERIAITNGILSGTRMMSRNEHVEIVVGMGGTMPEFLPTITLAILTYMSSLGDPQTKGTLAYDDCNSVTRVREQRCRWPWPRTSFVVGGIMPDSVHVSTRSNDCNFSQFGMTCGVGFMKKLNESN